MKFITDYKELGGKPDKSLLNHISDTPIPNKDVVLSYLKNGADDGVRCSSIFDYVKEDSALDTVHLFTDGEYYWSSEETYHFEKYNLELNDDFLLKVFRKAGVI